MGEEEIGSEVKELPGGKGMSTTIVEDGGAGGESDFDFSSIIPEGFGEKDWVKDLAKSEDPRTTLFQMLEDQRTTIAKRPGGIPEDTATEEEWATFDKSMGVPEDAAEYKFAVVEGQEVNEEYQKGLGEVLQKAGISKRQFEKLEPAFNELVSKFAPDPAAAAEKLETDFDKLALDTFGAEKDKVLTEATLLIGKHIPESMKPLLKDLPNESLIIMTGVLNSIRKEYISGDSLPNGGDGAATGETEGDKRAQGQKLMASKAFNDPFDPEHDRVVEQVGRLYGTWQG